MKVKFWRNGGGDYNQFAQEEAVKKMLYGFFAGVLVFAFFVCLFIGRKATEADASEGTPPIFFLSTRHYTWGPFMMNADGTGSKPLTSVKENNETSACFSLDGKKIVYASRKGSGHVSNIYIMNKDGSGQTKLSSDEQTDDYAPVFSGCSNWMRG